MIWINISNLLEAKNFSGIARTEYELSLYAYNLKLQGCSIKFSTFDRMYGFKELKLNEMETILSNLKNNSVVSKEKLNFFEKLNRSFCKRLVSLRLYCGVVNHCFSDGDTIVSVGQNIGSGETHAYGVIKKSISFKLKVLCHDLMPLNYSKFCFEKHTRLFSKYISDCVKCVDSYYCNSTFTKNELLDFYKGQRKQPPNMQVINLGCDLYKKDFIQNSLSNISFLINESYVLFVSTIEVRKNHKLIYEMYLKLLEEGVKDLPKVYFVGRRGWLVESLLDKLDNDPRIKDKILILNNISDSELVQLYKNCKFTLFPSFIEGYGLPIAESLSFGKYCISSNRGSMPEVGGDYIDYADPSDLDEWLEKFKFAISNPDYVARKEENIIEYYQSVDWEQCAKEILDQEFAN